MTDTADWSGVSSGAVTLLQTATINADNIGKFTVTTAGIPQTVRALLLLVTVKAVTAGGETYTFPVAVGNVSGQTWKQLAASASWEPDGTGDATVHPGNAMAPMYFPFYAGVDTGVSITWSATVSGGVADQVEYWLLGLPDPAQAGSPYNPLSVTNGADPNTGAAVPVSVEPANLFNWPVSEKDPNPKTPHIPVLVAAPSGVSTALVAAPPAGHVLEVVDMGFVGGPTTVAATVRIQGATSGGWLLADAGPTGTFLKANYGGSPIYLTEGLSIANVSGAAMNAFVVYRTLPQGTF